MKKLSIYFLAVTMLGLAGCKKSFDSLFSNPNKPTAVPEYLLLNGVLNDLYERPFTNSERWNQYTLSNYEYYDNNRYNFGAGPDYYGTIKNIDKMVVEAANSGKPDLNPYSAMAKFLKAWFFAKMTLAMGDIPMTQALQGEANLQPAYDTQKDVFIACLKWLDEANTEFAQLISQGASMQGDIYFGNDLSKWQKATNTLRLRLLLDLSNKADDSDLHVATQFSSIVSNPAQYPLMESADDNLEYNYIYPTNTYPNNPGNYGFDATRYNASATYVKLLTATKDPRVYITTEPAVKKIQQSVSPLDFAAYVGADPGEDLGVMYNKVGNGEYSLFNRYHYYQTYTAEPSIQLGYAEQCFTIAEAINRGWLASGPLGNAEDYYKEGIETSWKFYNIPLSGDLPLKFYVSGSPGSSNVQYIDKTATVDFNSFYSQPAVKYSGNNVTGLTQILQQRYIALFRHEGLEPYYTWRRTGVPEFTTGPGTGNSGRIALRFQYPSIERTANAGNYQDAIQRQFGGNDDINGSMWLLK